MDKKQILSDYNISEKHQSDFLKILDKIHMSTVKNISVCSEFLDPYVSAKLKRLMKYNYGYVSCSFFGGCEGAEREMLYVCADYEALEYIHMPLSLLRIKRPKKFDSITHRDVMGSVLSLGIVRDKIGDIVIDKEFIQIFVTEDIVDFIRFNLNKIKNVGVTPEVINIEDFIMSEGDFKVITGTVKSLRLDAVASLGFNTSRSVAADDIKREKIKVNHIPVNSPSLALKDGDLISYRGKGRIIFTRASGITKKDRIRIEIKRYL